MDEPIKTFDLSPEQQNTTALIQRLLGKRIADRYVDFCRLAIGAIGQFFFRNGIDDEWLMDQVISMSEAEFASTEPYSVMDRLSKISPEYPDRTAEVLAALVKNPRFDRWVYMTQPAAVRTILVNGLATGSPGTVSFVTETINYLSAMGDSNYLDLLAGPQSNKP
jgi:hypothetical protein